MISKFMSAVAWAVVYLHTNEVFPTKCRQSISTLLNLTGRIGGVLSQYLVHASKFQNERMNTIFLMSLYRESVSAHCKSALKALKTV